MKTFRTMSSIALCTLVLIVGAACALARNNAMVSVMCVDDDGIAMSDISVSANFEGDASRNVMTATNGLFEFGGKTYDGVLFYCTKPHGYYYSQGRYDLRWDPQQGRWRPWNPVVTCVVRRIVNPIPMYAKRVDTMIQATNRGYGFDLAVGDWTKPAGKGSASDLVFRVDGYWNNYRDNDSVLSLSFSHAGDGIREDSLKATGSSFPMSRTAANEGYRSSIQWRKARAMKEGLVNDVKVDDLKEAPGYLIRIRSVTNEVGAVTNACYGKIHPGIEFGGAGKDGCYLKFTYYLNPTPNDRNLEFDPKRNLMPNLKSTERVTNP